MAQRIIFIAIGVFLFANCSKSPETSPGLTTDSAGGQKTATERPTATDGAEKSGSPSSGPAGSAATLSNASEAELNVVLAELTQALRKFSFEHKRLPKTIDEVIAAAYLKNMPQAPAGKRFAIDSKNVQVVLVKQ